MITLDELKYLLHYDKNTGIFTWINQNIPRVKTGGIAGALNDSGYIVIKINNISYRAHRLAWLYITGEFPKQSIDHINGIKNDNRFINLRDISHAENCQNHTRHNIDNKTKTLGVTFVKRLNKFKAQIQINGVKRHLGCFDTAEEASNSYKCAKFNQLNLKSSLSTNPSA